MKYTPQPALYEQPNMTERLFVPGWSSRFGAVMLTVAVAAAFVAMSLAVA